MDSSPSLPSAQRPRPRGPRHEPSLPASLSGTKRPAPSLLPPFEPLSSPGLPRPLKRQNTAGSRPCLPTPVPTSSTGTLLSSSPPPPASRICQLGPSFAAAAVAAADAGAGAGAPITVAATSVSTERAPLSTVPAVELPENGESVTLGRSSNSSHVQLSANRLVSRVHVLARYVAAGTAAAPAGRIEITCNGWNGLKLHCQGRTWELFKGDTFSSETDGADIMVDVLDARVMIQWPRRSLLDHAASALSDSSGWEDSPSPSHNRGAAAAAAAHSLLLQSSSPLRRTTRIASPESPTPGRLSVSSSQRLQQSLLMPATTAAAAAAAARDQDGIQIYEDEPEDEPELPRPNPSRPVADVGASMRTDATVSFSSDPLSDVEDHDPDEENDPIIHSFGPFGADIAGRMASIMSKSPPKTIGAKAAAAAAAARRRPRETSSSDTLTGIPGAAADDAAPPSLPPSPTGGRPSTADLEASPSPEGRDVSAAEAAAVDPAVANHVVNQLAFSRLSSTPLSAIVLNLPAEARAAGLNREALRAAIEATACIGIIRRQGKDAAGKPLESEYYYVPEHDDDEQRRAAVVDGLRKPSLRACRKQHKQYYWKRPRTP